ncbi:sugar O-acetyltransferase [Eisenbergiella sp.]
MDIFERLRSGEAIHMQNVKEYHAVAHKEMDRCRKQCFAINSTCPEREQIWSLERELFQGCLPESTYLTPPFQVDYACQMAIGESVFANHGLTCMSAGGITLEDGVMLGPNVTLLTVNHDFEDLQIISCKPVVIKKGAWVGANSVILPGITIGEGAVIGSGSVVTHDVAPNAVAAGNPARVIKMIERS